MEEYRDIIQWKNTEPLSSGTSQRLQVLVEIGGGPFHKFFLQIGDRLDARVFLGVVLHDKNGNIF